MYDETNVPGPEYRVRTVVRFVVTRYCHPYVQTLPDGDEISVPGGSEVIAELPSERLAFQVAEAMAKAEAHTKATVSSG